LLKPREPQDLTILRSGGLATDKQNGRPWHWTLIAWSPFAAAVVDVPLMCSRFILT
jgi:hypothetical protein